MSAEEAVAGSHEKSVDHNAQAAEDAKNLLAELEADTSTNGNTNSKSEPQESLGDVGSKEPTETGKKNKSVMDKPTEQSRDHRGGRSRGGNFGHRGGKSKSFRDNIKSDLTTQETSSDPEAIRKQVEFYFSDSNLPMDKFLLEQVGGSKNNPVELSIIHSFKRMRHFQPFEAIVEALKGSKSLKLSEDNTKIQRKTPLPLNLDNSGDNDAIRIFEDKAMPRTVYVKGFGEEVPSTQFDIEAFFAPYGPTNAIRLRRTDTKLFKGSVFAEFENEDLATKFLELDPKPQYKGNDLMVMSKKEYCDKKVDDIKAGRIRAGKDRPFNNRSSRGGRGGGRRDGRKRDNEDDRDWRERREEDRKNGFKDKRSGHRDRRSNEKRSERSEHQGEKDENGIPVVKTTDRDAAKQDALAKARAAVESEQNASGNKKRDREDDPAVGEPPTKKVDVKED